MMRHDDRDEHGRESMPDPADELDELMYERFTRAEYDTFHNYLNRLHDEIFALRRQLANAPNDHRHPRRPVRVPFLRGRVRDDCDGRIGMSGLTREQVDAVPMKCDGACDEHIGQVRPVEVIGWGQFFYCDEAIAEDRRRGFTVIEQERT